MPQSECVFWKNKQLSQLGWLKRFEIRELGVGAFRARCTLDAVVILSHDVGGG